MPSPSRSRSGRRKNPGPEKGPRSRAASSAPRTWAGWTLAIVLSAAVLVPLVISVVLTRRWIIARSPQGQLERAEAATAAKDWPNALEAWRKVNRSPLRKGSTWLAEARAALAMGKAGEAETALEQSTKSDPTNPEPWRLLLELLRVEDRAIEAMDAGWAAYAAVPPKDRRTILRDLTLALLADLPEDLARDTLARWSASSTNTSTNTADARVALLQRMAAMPRAGDPARGALIAELTERLMQDPLHPGIRETLINALADAGDTRRGQILLDAWPANTRDARYWRLRGRWDLEYGHAPKEAAEAFARALESLPNDWKTRARFARALQSLGRTAEARHQAELVGRIREVLDPNRLGQRLAKAIEHLDDPKSLIDLADLTQKAGLQRLAQAWLREASGPR